MYGFSNNQICSLIAIKSHGNENITDPSIAKPKTFLCNLKYVKLKIHKIIEGAITNKLNQIIYE